MKKTETIFTYGQKLYRRRSGIRAYVVSKDAEQDYLIKMSNNFPYSPGQPHFFVHVEKLRMLWRHEKEGVQSKLF